MKVAETQAKNSGFYHFDRTGDDCVHICGKISSEWVDKINAYLIDPLLEPYDIKYNQIYKNGLKQYDSSRFYEDEYLELKDTYTTLKNAGYTDDFISFQCLNVQKTHEIDRIGSLFPFVVYNTRFSIVKPHSVSIYHFDHNFEAMEDGSKKYSGGFTEDKRCRKFLIALDNSYDNPEASFYFGNAPWLWRKGDIVPLDNGVPHYGANYGNKTRAFFMVTGIVNVDEYNVFCKKWNEIK